MRCLFDRVAAKVFAAVGLASAPVAISFASLASSFASFAATIPSASLASKSSQTSVVDACVDACAAMNTVSSNDLVSSAMPTAGLFFSGTTSPSSDSLKYPPESDPSGGDK